MTKLGLVMAKGGLVVARGGLGGATGGVVVGKGGLVVANGGLVAAWWWSTRIGSGLVLFKWWLGSGVVVANRSLVVPW